MILNTTCSHWIGFLVVLKTFCKHFADGNIAANLNIELLCLGFIFRSHVIAFSNMPVFNVDYINHVHLII